MKYPTLGMNPFSCPQCDLDFSTSSAYYNEKLNSKKWPQNLDLRPCYQVLAIFPTVHWVWANSATYLTRVAEEKELHEGIGGDGTLS